MIFALCATFIIVALVGALIKEGKDLGFGSNQEPTGLFARPPKDYGPEAYYAATICLKNQLKAPATAKFPDVGYDEGTGYRLEGTNCWQVWGYVDAQNSYGANLRTRWTATVELSSQGYRVTHSQFDQP